MKLQSTVPCFLVTAGVLLSLHGHTAPIVGSLGENRASFGSGLATLSKSALAVAENRAADKLPNLFAAATLWHKDINSSSISFSGSIDVYSGNRVTDTFASMFLPKIEFNKAGPDPTGLFSPFASIKVSFDGVARRDDFDVTENEIAINNITFGYAAALRKGLGENKDLVENSDADSDDNSKATKSATPLAITEPPSAAFFILGIAALIGRRLRKP